VQAGYDQAEMMKNCLLNLVDVYMSKTPACWFMVSYMHDAVDTKWRVLRVLCGWAETNIHEYVEDIINDFVQVARHNNCSGVMFNRDGYFLHKMLTVAEELDSIPDLEAIWLKVQW
jgi:type IV secretory pathway VirB4 component